MYKELGSSFEVCEKNDQISFTDDFKVSDTYQDEIGRGWHYTVGKKQPKQILQSASEMSPTLQGGATGVYGLHVSSGK